MRELEGQAVSDMFREVVGVRAGRTGLCLLVPPREMAVKTKKSIKFFMMALSRSGSGGVERVADRVKSCSSRSVFYTSPSLPLLVH